MALSFDEYLKRLALGDAAVPSLDAESLAGVGERRKPTVDAVRNAGKVKQSTPATVGGDDSAERDVMGASVDEQAVLNDPRASATYVQSGRHFNDAKNRFLALAGLPTSGYSNAAVEERDKMRQWLLAKGQAKSRDEMATLNADRTRAYLEATQAAKERDAYARQYRAEQDGRKADAEAAKLELEQLKLKHAQERETWQRGMDERGMKLKEDEAKRKAAPKPKPAPGPALAPKGFPAGWELEGQTQPTPRQGEQFEGLVYSSEKMRGLTSQMREMLSQAGSGRVLPGAAKSRMSQLAKEIQIEGKNIAELGALSGPDYSLMEAIAADPTKLDSFAKDMPALLDGLDRWGDNSVAAKARSLGARRTAQAGATTPPPEPTGATVIIRRKSDGKQKTLPRESAAKYLADPAFEEVK